MEFSQIFGFLIIFKDSIKILSKNGKFMTPITILSLLLPSILLLAVTHTYQSWTDFMTKSSYSSYIPTISFSALLLLVEIAFGIAFVKISHASGVAAILVTATSYTDSATSARDLCSRIRAACRMKLQKNKLSGSMAMSTPALLSLVLTLLILLLAVLFYLDPAAIFVAIVVVDLVCVYQLYYLVVPVMSRVVSVVEERGGEAAVERAEEVVRGQIHHGFMINLFFNLLFLVFLGSWILFGKRLRLQMNQTAIWWVLLNSFSLLNIFGWSAYTVLYFHCKKFHCEEFDSVSDLEFTKMGDSNLGDGVAKIVECK